MHINVLTLERMFGTVGPDIFGARLIQASTFSSNSPKRLHKSSSSALTELLWNLKANSVPQKAKVIAEYAIIARKILREWDS
jgi:hypothetical protein